MLTKQKEYVIQALTSGSVFFQDVHPMGNDGQIFKYVISGGNSDLAFSIWKDDQFARNMNIEGLEVEINESVSKGQIIQLRVVNNGLTTAPDVVIGLLIQEY